MAAQYQVTDIPFGTGLDERTDQRLSCGQSFVTLTNLVSNKNGTFDKRNGFTSQSRAQLNDGNATTAGNNALQFGAMCANASRPLALNRGLYGFNSAQNAWTYYDQVPEITATRFPAAAESSGYGDVAVIGSIACIAYQVDYYDYGGSSPTSLRARIGVQLVNTDTGAVIMPEKVLGLLGSHYYVAPRVVAVGTTFYVTYTDIGTAPGGGALPWVLYGHSIDSTSATPAPSASFTITSDQGSAVHDTLFLSGSTWAVAYYRNTSTDCGLTLMTNASITNTIHSAGKPYASLAKDSTYLYAFTTDNGTDLRYITVDLASWMVVTTTNLAALGTTLTASAATLWNGNVWCFVTDTAAKAVRYFAVNNTTMIYTGPSMFAAGLALQSAPFVWNGRLYVGVQTLQPSAKLTDCIGVLCEVTDLSVSYGGNGNWLRPVCTFAPRYLSPLAAYPIVPHAAPAATLLSNGSNYAYSLAFPLLNNSGGVITSATYTAPNLLRYAYESPNRHVPISVGDQVFLPGGVPSFFDGNLVTEAGFFRPSNTMTATKGGVGSLNPTGIGITYTWAIVWEFVDGTGRVTRSEPSFAALTLLAADMNVDATVKITPLALTARQDGENGRPPVRCLVYRSNGGMYYYETSFSFEPHQTLYSYSGVKSDANLDQTRILYTTGTSTDVAPWQVPASGRFAAFHRGRIHLGGCDDPNLVYFTNQLSSGETPKFNDRFTYRVDEGEAITGIASLDDSLIIFTRNAIWILAGDGPNENGLNSDYALRRMSTDVGCVEHRSIVSMDEGVMFLSPSGLMLLDRGLNLKKAGLGVEGELALYPNCNASCLVAEQNQVWFAMSSADGSGSGETLVYNQVTDSWSTFSYAAHSFLGLCSVNGTPWASSYSASAVKYDASTWLDDGAFVVSTWKTPWLRVTPGPQSSWLVKRIAVLAQKLGNANALFLVNYAMPSYTSSASSTHGFTNLDASLNPGTDEFMLWPTTLRVEAVQITGTDGAPTDGSSVGVGRGYRWQGLAIEGAYKGRTAPKVPGRGA